MTGGWDSREQDHSILGHHAVCWLRLELGWEDHAQPGLRAGSVGDQRSSVIPTRSGRGGKQLVAQFLLPPLGGLRLDVGKDQEEQNDPVQLWRASGPSPRAESTPFPVFSNLVELRFWALQSLEPKLGSPGYSAGKRVTGLASTHFPLSAPPIILGPSAGLVSGLPGIPTPCWWY